MLINRPWESRLRKKYLVTSNNTCTCVDKLDPFCRETSQGEQLQFLVTNSKTGFLLVVRENFEFLETNIYQIVDFVFTSLSNRLL